MRNMEFHLGGEENRKAFYDEIMSKPVYYGLLEDGSTVGPLRVSTDVSVNLDPRDVHELVGYGYDPRNVDICQFGRAKQSIMHDSLNGKSTKSRFFFYSQYLGLPIPSLRDRAVEIGDLEAAIELGVLEIESA